MRRLPVALFVMSLSTAVLTACNDDGRTLRPAAPAQTASVSTSSTTLSVRCRVAPSGRITAA
ncbi:MAG: hypothetical protein ACO3AV_13690, partial [Ilumatobacteraceae bacterium]